MEHAELRRQLVHVMQEMGRAGLNEGTSGNVSVRLPEGLLITPTGVEYTDLTPEDMAVLDWDGEVLPSASPWLPSSEWRFHRDLLVERTDIHAVLHAHPPYATALACLQYDIPAFHYMVAAAGGPDIRCASYATFGTQALSENALAALIGRRACLLANHGLIVLGEDLTGAMRLAREVEGLARQYVLARQIGEPVILEGKEMARVLEKFKGYGQPARRRSQ